MTKAGDLNWDDFYKSNEPKSNLRKTNTKKVPSAQYHQDKPVGTAHKNAYSGPSEEELKKQKLARPINKKGEVPRRPSDGEIAKAILGNMPANKRQPTAAEFIAAGEAMGLVKSDEEVEAAEKDWEGRLNNIYEAAKAKVEKHDSKADEAWESGQSFNSTLSEEELQKRNTYINEDE